MRIVEQGQYHIWPTQMSVEVVQAIDCILLMGPWQDSGQLLHDCHCGGGVVRHRVGEHGNVGFGMRQVEGASDGVA